VELPAVELDDQPRVGPVGVDLVALDDGVHDGSRQPVLVAEAQEAALEAGASGRAAPDQRGEPARRPLGQGLEPD
jgi:hypothetical protein